MSKTITKVFPSAERTVIYLNGKRYPSFRGIRRVSPTAKDDTIKIGSPFTISNDTDGKLHITCPTVWKLNNTPVSLTSIFVNNRLTVKSQDYVLENESLGLPNTCNLSQQTVNAVLTILQQLRICRGKLSSSIESDEVWINVISGEKENRVRSPRCERVVQLMSIDDMCQSCKIKFRKRSLTTEDQNDQCQEQASTTPLVEDSDTEKLSEDEHVQMLAILKAVQGKTVNFNDLLQCQLINQYREPNGRRWSKDIIRICLNMYCRSPRSYTDLKSTGVLVLPSTRLLRYYKNSVSQSPGINNEHLAWMSKEADLAALSEFGRRGGILIDEMSIQDDIQIVRKGDGWSLVGMVDLGDACNNVETIINSKRTLKMATHVLQVVFHGFSGFRWPVAYYGTTSATAHQLYRIFWDVVEKLDDHGFYVEYLMMDGASSNRSLTSILLPGDKIADKYSFVNIYDRSKRISIIQDIKHCLKKLRNGIESSKDGHKSERSKGRYLMLNGKAILWNHFEQAFEFNDQLGLRIHPKLTKDHIDLTPVSKMRNELATSVLDRNMLYLMKSYQATLKRHYFNLTRSCMKYYMYLEL